MELIVRCFEGGMLIWFALLAIIVVGRVLDGELETSGMLTHESRDQETAPERALSMAIFPVVIVSYAYTALHADVQTTHSLPPISDNLVTLLTGSNGLYLAGKFTRSSYRRTP